ncbi:unnamed protein product [Euphydryas editha]|uniref:Histone-lysine N-methyltransferase SETMAR n=1 Tax=Euphydryas editha TaxID=104508 RepID=A0AAU9TUR6_EUPED|nr:unnamed protein product [Euphydryas editha]
MDPLVLTRYQGTVETMDFTRRTWSEEGEDCPIGRKGPIRRRIAEIMTPFGEQKVLFHNDTSAVTTAKLVEFGYKLLLHPPYSPELASCDFLLFPNLKKTLGGKEL